MSLELISNRRENIDNKKRLKYSKKFNFCNLKERNNTKRIDKQLKTNRSLTKRLPLSLINKKLEKHPSIFEFKSKRNRQVKKKNV